MSITITITIDGGEVSTTTVSPQSLTATSSQPPGLLTPATGTMDAGAAPGEVELSNMAVFSSPLMERNAPLANAGGMSAGSAPSGMELSGLAGLSSSFVEQNIPIGGVGDITAGSAPNSPPTEH